MTVRAAASVRCYAELDELLLGARRDAETTVEFDVGPSVKDAIERLGVPHTEVDLLLVNGSPVDFAYRLRDGDRVAVYPKFHTIDIASVTQVRAPPLAAPRFVLDTHLGRLAAYLRLGGFDSDYLPFRDDAELARASVETARTLLTRDRGLLRRRTITHGYLVRATDPREQFVEVLRRFELASQLAPFTRCLACNGELRDAAPDEIACRVPDRARSHFNRFRACPECGRVYWEGSHHAQLERLVDDARRACELPAAQH